MSKWHESLTEEDMDRYSLRETLRREIEHCRERFQLPKSEFRICDLGCGRGRTVLGCAKLVTPAMVQISSLARWHVAASFFDTKDIILMN